jgi:hypothetical protein
MVPSVYSVTLHQLAPGATAAGLAYADEQLPAVNVAQLREMLHALNAVAARMTIYEPSSPEIRVKTDRDVFVIRTRNRQLCFIGWESILRGEEHSVSYILSTITGTAEPVKTTTKVERKFATTAPIASTSAPSADNGRVPRRVKIAVLTTLIIGFNAVTAWLLLRPAPSPVPHYNLLAETESHALLTKVTGEYETGVREGDRRLLIDPDGTLHLAKFGKNRVLTEEKTKTARGAIVDGRAALLTSDPAVLDLKDADTVVLYGTPYRRRSR